MKFPARGDEVPATHRHRLEATGAVVRNPPPQLSPRYHRAPLPPRGCAVGRPTLSSASLPVCAMAADEWVEKQRREKKEVTALLCVVVVVHGEGDHLFFPRHGT